MTKFKELFEATPQLPEGIVSEETYEEYSKSFDKLADDEAKENGEDFVPDVGYALSKDRDIKSLGGKVKIHSPVIASELDFIDGKNMYYEVGQTIDIDGIEGIKCSIQAGGNFIAYWTIDEDGDLDESYEAMNDSGMCMWEVNGKDYQYEETLSDEATDDLIEEIIDSIKENIK